MFKVQFIGIPGSVDEIAGAVHSYLDKKIVGQTTCKCRHLTHSMLRDTLTPLLRMKEVSTTWRASPPTTAEILVGTGELLSTLVIKVDTESTTICRSLGLDHTIYESWFGDVIFDIEFVNAQITIPYPAERSTMSMRALAEDLGSKIIIFLDLDIKPKGEQVITCEDHDNVVERKRRGKIKSYIRVKGNNESLTKLL